MGNPNQDFQQYMELMSNLAVEDVVEIMRDDGYDESEIRPIMDRRTKSKKKKRRKRGSY